MATCGLIIVTVSLRSFAPKVLAARTVMGAAMAAVGVPDKSPAALSVSPEGNVPAVTLQVIGVVPVAV